MLNGCEKKEQTCPSRVNLTRTPKSIEFMKKLQIFSIEFCHTEHTQKIIFDSMILCGCNKKKVKKNVTRP